MMQNNKPSAAFCGAVNDYRMSVTVVPCRVAGVAVASKIFDRAQNVGLIGRIFVGI